VWSLHSAVSDILRTPTADARVLAFILETGTAAGRLECYYSRVPARAEREVNRTEVDVDRQGYRVMQNELLKPVLVTTQRLNI
jgi:hypothetical protein